MEGSQEVSSVPEALPDAPSGSGPPTVHASLAVLSALLNLEADDQSLSSLLQVCREVFHPDQVLVLREDEGNLLCVAALHLDVVGRRCPMGELLQSVLVGRVWASNFAPAPADWPDLPAELIAPGQPALCLPIGIGDQRAALVLLREGPEGFGDDHVAVARQCSGVSLAALVARMGSKLESEISHLSDLVAQLRQTEHEAQQKNKLLQEIVDHLPIALSVQDADGKFIVVNSIAAANLATPADSLIGVSPSDFLSLEDAASRREWEVGLMRSGHLNVAEEIVPTEAGEQTWLTSHKALQLLDQTLLVTTSLDITERKRVEMDLAERVHFDELTGIPNRILIQKHVEGALGRSDNGERFALAFIDLDNFKHINDYYSHAIGDALLVKLARRVAKRLREGDMLARISGDEFLLFLDQVKSDDDIHTIVSGILEDLKQPFQIEAFEIFTSASIGVSVHPEHGSTFEELRRNADNAMYRAKASTKGAATYFDVRMGQTITARMESEQRLRLAIRDRRFCCAFQPKIDIRTEEVVGFETLVRWRDDDGEIHPPSAFIELAIELGLIDPITCFVLTEALQSIDCLDAAFGSDTTISINVAAKQAGDVNFMRSLVETLKASNRADRVMIELTEDAFVAKREFQTQILPMLREIGVRVSIDDFGTGYSSLSALADITADELKVDRSFISGIHERPRSQSILRTIESLGNSLGMTIVAEGVETFEELTYLQAATRIRYAQGYYFSKPFFLDDAAKVTPPSLDRRQLEAAREPSDRRGLRPGRAQTDGRARSG